MSPTWNKALQQAMTGVLESMCFMVPTPASMFPGLNVVSEVVSRVHVSFSGPSSGVLELAFPASLADAITSSMLGDDGPHPDETRAHAICELANITCGNLLPLIAGEQAIFNLDSPKVVPNTQALQSADASTAIRLDDGLIQARLKLASPVVST